MAKNDQHGAKRVPKTTNVEPKGCPPKQPLLQNQALDRSKLYFFYVDVFRQNGKKGHGTLVRLNFVRGTSVDQLSFSSFLKKVGKHDFWHLLILLG